MADIKHILANKNLRQTTGRTELLTLFIRDRNLAISESEINRRLKGKMDRANVYRNLKAFEENEIIHKVPSPSGAPKFALNKDILFPSKNNVSPHIHFHCIDCDKTFCLSEIIEQQISLPEGFSEIENEFLVKGVCQNCNEKQER